MFGLQFPDLRGERLSAELARALSVAAIAAFFACLNALPAAVAAVQVPWPAWFHSLDGRIVAWTTMGRTSVWLPIWMSVAFASLAAWTVCVLYKLREARAPRRDIVKWLGAMWIFCLGWDAFERGFANMLGTDVFNAGMENLSLALPDFFMGIGAGFCFVAPIGLSTLIVAELLSRGREKTPATTA